MVVLGAVAGCVTVAGAAIMGGGETAAEAVTGALAGGEATAEFVAVVQAPGDAVEESMADYCLPTGGAMSENKVKINSEKKQTEYFHQSPFGTTRPVLSIAFRPHPGEGGL